MNKPEFSPIRVLGIAGSLWGGSYNRALLRAAQELVPCGMHMAAFLEAFRDFVWRVGSAEGVRPLAS